MRKKKPVTTKSRNQNRLYQADESFAGQLQKVREKLLPLCHQYKNHAVHIETIDGRTFEGTIVDVDAGHLYLQTQSQQRAYYPYPYTQPYPYPYPRPNSNVILPLVLYELLVIALL
ncbi:acetyl-CoA acetyltransferase [Paenibacillus sp. GCM10027629]|uniref:acetyl-CoA acetyltransferase n=1 Tax=Paenibacillus sp. GCM10027629 TaxID=3273414 RepID=UPI003638A992